MEERCGFLWRDQSLRSSPRLQKKRRRKRFPPKCSQVSGLGERSPSDACMTTPLKE